jgi:hypothetical protein
MFDTEIRQYMERKGRSMRFLKKAGSGKLRRSLDLRSRGVPINRECMAVKLEWLENRRLLSGVSFAADFDYPTYPNPRSVITADFNGDGRADLAIRNNGSHVRVMINDGKGSFRSGVDYLVGKGDYFPYLEPSGNLLTAGDFNGDGRIDIATVNFSAVTVTVLINKGGGVFADGVDYNAGGLPKCINASDFNGDGKLDLAIGTRNGRVIVRLNDGRGMFSDIRSYSWLSSVFFLFATDLTATE